MYTIVVVDDSRVMRKVVMKVIKSVCPDCRFLEADSGEAALHHLEGGSDHGIDLVFCDLTMPRMDGIAFLESLSKRAPKPKVPVIVLTADARESRGREALEKGASRVLSKPLRIEDVADVVESLQANQRTSPSSA